jgi:hypothetical protein
MSLVRTVRRLRVSSALSHAALHPRPLRWVLRMAGGWPISSRTPSPDMVSGDVWDSAPRYPRGCDRWIHQHQRRCSYHTHRVRERCCDQSKSVHSAPGWELGTSAMDRLPSSGPVDETHRRASNRCLPIWRGRLPKHHVIPRTAGESMRIIGSRRGGWSGGDSCRKYDESLQSVPEIVRAPTPHGRSHDGESITAGPWPLHA